LFFRDTGTIVGGSGVLGSTSHFIDETHTFGNPGDSVDAFWGAATTTIPAAQGGGNQAVSVVGLGLPNLNKAFSGVNLGGQTTDGLVSGPTTFNDIHTLDGLKTHDPYINNSVVITLPGLGLLSEQNKITDVFFQFGTTLGGETGGPPGGGGGPPVPEPSVLFSLCGLGVMGLFSVRKWKRV
jgi:hypothetical protein